MVARGGAEHSHRQITAAELTTRQATLANSAALTLIPMPGIEIRARARPETEASGLMDRDFFLKIPERKGLVRAAVAAMAVIGG